MSKNITPINKEYRYIDSDTEFRVSTEGDKTYLEGYGIVFNRDSHPIYGMFIERIDPRALDNADTSQIISKYNHDISRVLGTTWANTLTFSIDSKGVKYRVLLPDTETGREVKHLTERGDLRGSSFEFRIAKEGAKWTQEDRGGIKVDIRTVTNISELLDLSPVMRPAYPDTEGKLKTYKRERDEALGINNEDTPQPVSRSWIEIYAKPIHV